MARICNDAVRPKRGHGESCLLCESGDVLAGDAISVRDSLVGGREFVVQLVPGGDAGAAVLLALDDESPSPGPGARPVGIEDVGTALVLADGL